MSDLRKPGVAEVVWQLGHDLWHAVRADMTRSEAYERMREPAHGDLVIELTHRYGAAAAVSPELVGWFVSGTKYRPVIAPLGADYRRIAVENGVIVALPIRADIYADDAALPMVGVAVEADIVVPGRPGEAPLVPEGVSG